MAAPPPGDPTALTKTADLSAAPTAPVSAMTPAPTEAPSSQSMAPHEGKPPAKPEPPKPPPVEQELFRHEAEARLRNQLQARIGFVERLVAFWSNHFAVSVAKGNELEVAAGPFEREAIRPNVLGKFGALLRAAESHPAMILYLDNQNSIGPARRRESRRPGTQRESSRGRFSNCTRWASGPVTRRLTSPNWRAF